MGSENQTDNPSFVRFMMMNTRKSPVIPLCGASSQLAAPRYVLFWPSGGVVPLINDTHDQVSQDLLSQTCAKDTAAALQTILGSLKEGIEQTSELKVGKVETGIQVQPNSW